MILGLGTKGPACPPWLPGYGMAESPVSPVGNPRIGQERNWFMIRIPGLEKPEKIRESSLTFRAGNGNVDSSSCPPAGGKVGENLNIDNSRSGPHAVYEGEPFPPLRPGTKPGKGACNVGTT